MIFTDSSLLLIGAALTALVLVGLWSHGARRRKLARFLGGRRALDRVARADLSRYGVRRTLLLGLACAALTVAAAGPRWRDAPEPVAPVKRAMIALDISASMQAADVQPTRLARAVEVARRVLDDLEGQEAGLLLYAGRTYPLAPPTRDLNAIRFMLTGVTPTVASAYDPGTQVSLAIDEAMALLARGTDSTTAGAAPSTPPPEDMIVFVSDGDSDEPDEALQEALERASEAGVAVHAIGVGTDEATRIVMPRGTYQIGGTVTDARGNPALTSLDETTLRRLASDGGGLYASAASTGDLESLNSELRAPTVPPDPDPLDAPPAWAAYDIPFLLGTVALAFIFLESLIGVTLPRRSPSYRAREAT